MSVRFLDDLREYDAIVQARCREARARLSELLSGKLLTLAQARVHRVLIPMLGVYTPGSQALPAVSWGFVELVSKQGPIGTGEWSIDLDQTARRALTRLQAEPELNLLDPSLEKPLFMAWWDLVGQMLETPLHQLWSELFEVGFTPPERVPLAAYSWPRFPDADGSHEVTADSWPDFALTQVEAGFTTLKLSMTSYDPDEYVDIIARIRARIPAHIDIRIDAHGSWNFAEARRILSQLEPLRVSYFEQPLNALLPERFFPPGSVPTYAHRQGFQAEYYYRKLEELRKYTSIPFSDHWWTPPLIQPPQAHPMDNAWEPDWYLLERYDPVDISNPDIGLGVFGLWRLLQLARFMGLQITLHSNFELGLQSVFRGAMFSALGYYLESAGLYMGTAPRLCLPMDTEYNQVSDDVLIDGKLPIVEGHLDLSPSPGHGRRLDPERLARYRYSEHAVKPHRDHALRLLHDYQLDRPRTRTMAGWPKGKGPERIGRLTYPYDLTAILGLESQQDVDVELNM
jgi:L-alanine-DL-glutamate epimerase-like enolase superfamily enzyme